MKETKEVKPTFEIEPIAEITSVGSITSNFKEIKSQALKIKEFYGRLVFAEEDMKTAKQERTVINNIVESVKRYRIDTIKDYKKPIEEFENDAKETEKILTETSSYIGTQTNAYEDSIKGKKEEEIISYFNEYAQSLNIDFVSYEQANINVTLTASVKSLKEQAKAFLDGINDDWNLIKAQPDYYDRMFVRFKSSLNATSAVTTVLNEVKAEAEAKSAREEAEKIAVAIAKQEPIEKPLEQPKEVDTQVYRIRFTVVGSKDELASVKRFLIEKGIKYESE